MAEDHIRYDILTREALRGVVKKVLTEVATTGLPGNHHFFISFATRAAGVRIAPRLIERYPAEMTIVLQNQFWDLSVNDTGFEVGLSFDDRPEKLIIPFSAILGFFDPSVEFGLKFEVEELEDGLSDADAGDQPAQADAKPAPEKEPTDGDADQLEPEREDNEDKVVSLDSFRKKT